MCLRRAVPKIPAKSSVSPSLLVYKNHALPTRTESTLLQLLIPLHFISPRINTYKKQGRGSHPSNHEVLQLVTTHASPTWTRPQPQSHQDTGHGSPAFLTPRQA